MLEEDRPEKSLRKLLRLAGSVETPPVEQLRRRNIAIVTDTEIRADPETGEPVKTVVRRGLRIVAKIDWLLARKMIDQPQYEAALTVLSWLRRARLSAPSAMLLLLESPRRGELGRPARPDGTPSGLMRSRTFGGCGTRAARP